MDDTSQIQPPESFVALFRSRAGRLQAPIAEIVARYELCEDLACHLVEQAQTIYHAGNASEEGVLLGFYAAISAEGAAVNTAEAAWIIQRLAELLAWKAPHLNPLIAVLLPPSNTPSFCDDLAPRAQGHFLCPFLALAVRTRTVHQRRD
jgi:hypothetical protein